MLKISSWHVSQYPEIWYSSAALLLRNVFALVPHLTQRPRARAPDNGLPYKLRVVMSARFCNACDFVEYGILVYLSVVLIGLVFVDVLHGFR